ncbi:MAG: hypothetical protein JXR45_21005 [Deltaproteobacteria bacterium]|nr:hypothetical protein [Deltaproteobacteria bacterium]
MSFLYCPDNTCINPDDSDEIELLNQEFLINLPANYDRNKPYRLLFGMHWMGGNMQSVEADGFFQLKPFDVQEEYIWVAPQGYSDTTPWRGGDDKDHIFFDDLLNLIETELCIDTSRVFVVGFSFGTMYTNALAQTHQDRLRAVVVYSTADSNIYFPANTGSPLAYMGVHGLSDPLCPFSSGSDSKDRFVQNNGCTVPASVPIAANGTPHVVYDYEDCNGYPVKWCTFDGGHLYNPKDDDEPISWVPEETWGFISQF